MNRILKTGFLLGLGAAVTGKEKVDETLSKLVETGSLSKAEAETLFDGMLRKGEEKSEVWNDEIKGVIKNQLSEMGFVTREELDLVQAELVLLKEELSNLRNRQESMNNNEKDMTISENDHEL